MVNCDSRTWRCEWIKGGGVLVLLKKVVIPVSTVTGNGITNFVTVSYGDR